MIFDEISKIRLVFLKKKPICYSQKRTITSLTTRRSVQIRGRGQASCSQSN
jgi:hypothetical protein